MMGTKGFIPHITGSKILASSNKEKPKLVRGESTASKCPIGSPNHPWG
ncbi:MAG: hypothetical protein ACQEWU_11245 [Bacillota bacterium]|nr:MULTISPECIES: hypothetical protein [Virgibacillus]MCC2249876.1 hypothetical protein [Virgibacillus sp. AGTR]MDY7045571.1 hypothetical protein [Virgibacillus sp. M23]QRZ18651.1 hypothetical protein JUJ52_02540 [Virgibacillus sp. AGTR]WBX81772.1 hypothetical protein PD280_08910 [Virgibacillus salarius]